VKLFRFNHEGGTKAGCCNRRVVFTYWMAETREQAEEEIKEETPDWRGQPHGNCANCVADLLAEEDYEIVKNGGGE